jgi:hypothetical protein
LTRTFIAPTAQAPGEEALDSILSELLEIVSHQVHLALFYDGQLDIGAMGT